MEDRSSFYKLPEVEAIFTKVLEKMETIKPVFDLTLGYHYPNVEEATGLDATGANNLLNTLKDAGVLDQETYDMELRCPYCNSPNASVLYECPHCESNEIKKTMLMEHLTCGYLGPVEGFGEKLVCPKCKNKLVEGEYRNTGSIYECGKCSKQIDTPFISHWCRSCDKKFNFDNCVYQPVYAYSPTQRTKKDISNGILYISKVASIFADLGFNREANSKVTAESGVEQVFDATFTKGLNKIYFDLIQSEIPVDEAWMIKEYGKMLDSKGTVFLIVMPSLDKKASVISKTYKLNVVEAEKPDDALEQLRKLIIEKVPGTTSEAKPAKKEEKKSRFSIR
jgi:hypothetical protein